MDTDLAEDINLEENNAVPDLLQSTIVQKTVLIKILRKLESLLDEEFSDPKNNKKYEIEFLKIIKALNEKKINTNEFFEEDIIVRNICKKIFEKLIRNFSTDIEYIE